MDDQNQPQPKPENTQAEETQNQNPEVSPQTPTLIQDNSQKPESPEPDPLTQKSDSLIKEDKPKKSKKLLIIISAIVLVLASFGLGTYLYQKKLNKDVAAQRQAAQYINHITVAYGSDSAGSYPDVPYEFVAMNYASHYYEGLTSFNSDMELRPQLAQSWENPNANTWRFRLRQDVIFHNGQKMTADDVVASFQLAMSNEDYKTLSPTVDSVKKVDDYTVDITTNTPTTILVNTITQTFILPKSLIASKNWSHPIGTGSYKFVSTDGSNVNLTRFDNYYGQKAKVKNVTIKGITEESDRLTALKNGDIDVMAVFVPIADGSTTKDGKLIKFATSDPVDANFLYLDIVRDKSPYITGVKTNPLKDLRVRQAMSYALDVPALINSGDYNKNDKQATQLVPPTIFGYNSDIKAVKQDVVKARALMKEAGYQNGFTITLDTLNDKTSFQRILVEQFATIGITLKVNKVVADEAGINKLMNGDWSMAIFSWPSTSGDALEAYEGILGTGGSGNIIKLSDPEIDSLIAKTKATADLSKRKEYLKQLAVMEDNKKYVIPLLSEKVVFAYRDGLVLTPRADGQNFAFETSGTIPSNLKNYTYLDTISKILHIKI